MRSFYALTLALLLSAMLALGGCGGSDGSGAATGGNLVPAGTTPGPVPVDPGTDEPGAGEPAAIQLNSSLPASTLLSQGGQATITATVFDGEGNLVDDGTLVTFTATSGDITPSATTSQGQTVATFQAGTTGGSVLITATADTATDSITVEVAVGEAASILTESVSPGTIGVFGSGIEDTSQIKFQVRDESGNPAPDGTEVEFAIRTPLGGGESLTFDSGTTAGGNVMVALQSGSVAGTVTVTASITTSEGKLIITEARVTIVSSTPDAGRIIMGAETLNLAGGVTLGLQSTLSAYLGDRFGNVVPNGTPVSFISECGTIGQSGGFTTTTNFGVASAALQTSSPTVPDLDGLAPEGNPGLCRVVAFTPGKGNFLDLNGNGAYEAGTDSCVTEMDEPYIDANDSGSFEAGEFYVDVDGNGAFSSDVVNCIDDTMIWTSMNILISDDVAPINLFPTNFQIAVGESQTFTFDLMDIWGNALTAGTSVKVETDAGTLVGLTEFTVPDTTGPGGTYSFALASNPGEEEKPATVTVTITPPGGENTNLRADETFEIASGMVNVPEDDTTTVPDTGPAPSSGDPASVLFSVSEPHITVSGVGQVEQTTFNIQVVDDSGAPINEEAYDDPTLNNLRVSFVTRPYGGEYLAGEGVDAEGERVVVDTRGAGSIELRTVDGMIPVNLKSGTLPGTVEVRVEVLVDADGNALTDPVIASLPQVSISSGPPHTIVLTSAITASVVNELGWGFYRRQGTAMVTDRYGNSVPDGTAINLGLIDSVIAEGTASSVSGSTMTAGAATIGATITRNETSRGIQGGDRVILRGVPAQDKSRHAASASGTTLTVQNDYSGPYTNKEFLVGSSLLGGYISGTIERGNAETMTTGITLTRDGVADIFVTYPANINTINVGCGNVPNIDERHLPIGSAKVFTVAASSDDSAITVDEGRFCFSPIAGFSVEAVPAKLTDSGQVTLLVRDGGDTIPVPYEPVSAFVTIDSLGTYGVCSDSAFLEQESCEAAGTCSDPTYGNQTSCEENGGGWTLNNTWQEFPSQFNVSATGGITDVNGFFVSTVTIFGRPNVASGDTATVTFVSGDGETTVNVRIP